MVGNLKQASMLVGVVAATTFCTAVAAVVGIVPRVGETTSVRTTAAAELAQMDRVPENVRNVVPSEIVPTTVTTVATVAPVTTTAPTVAPTTTTAPVAVIAVPEPDPNTAEPAAPEAAPDSASAPGPPARRVPSPAEVQQAIQGMEKYVTFKSGLLGLVADVPTPTAEQVNELADKACTAFDEGQTLEQVKATGMAMAADNRWVTISPAGADYVATTAVTLYCPGHADKLA